MPTSQKPHEIESQFFDDFVESAGDFNPFTDRGWNTIRGCFESVLVEFDMPGSGLDVLDVGCGTGMSKAIYDGHYRSYTGVDLSKNAIQLASERFRDVDWRVADACDLPFDDATFDVVAFSSVLHHIPDYSMALREAYRVLRPLGIAFAFDPNLLHPAMALLRHPKSPLYLRAGVSPNERPLHPKSLRDAFLSSGFTSILQHSKSDIPYRKVSPSIINWFLRTYNLCDWVWERVGLGRAFGTFVITAGIRR